METENGQNTLAKEESQLVTFLLKDEEFGFDIMSVQEIIRLPQMAKVPRTPAYVEGIANLRGVVLPIIDMRKRFGMERAEDTDRTRILVVDIDGVKTGLRVDRVQQVTRVLRSDVEAPPAAIRGTSSEYLQGVVKLDNGQRIIMALNAAQVCRVVARQNSEGAEGGHQAAAQQNADTHGTGSVDDIRQMVTFRIAKEEFAFAMEHVREILRVQAPNQVPDVPDYVLGVLTVRGQILPIIDLRRLLHQVSLAEEIAASCREIRERYSHWLESELAAQLDLSRPEQLRNWLINVNSSSQILMEQIAKLRALNDRLIKQVQARAAHEELKATGKAILERLQQFEGDLAANIREDQRVIVVDANGVVTGLVVDHVNEVMNISKSLLHPPPQLTASDGVQLEAVAKLDEGRRLIMLLDIASLIHDQSLKGLTGSGHTASASATESTSTTETKGLQEHSEIQLVTFLLGEEEYGVPISKIQEIDRLSKITKVPKAAHYVEGITNLRGEVIPVLDTRKRFDLETRTADDRSRIMIMDLGGVKTGLIVDSVREVLSISRSDIAPPPEAIHSGVDHRFVAGIGKVNQGKRMIVLLDVEQILSQNEKNALAGVADNAEGSRNDLLRLEKQTQPSTEGVLQS